MQEAGTTTWRKRIERPLGVYLVTIYDFLVVGLIPVTDPRLIPPQLGYGNVVARNDVVGRAVPGRDGHLGVGLRG